MDHVIVRDRLQRLFPIYFVWAYLQRNATHTHGIYKWLWAKKADLSSGLTIPNVARYS